MTSESNTLIKKLGFCKYKNMFGEEKSGIHSYRFFGMAIADVIMTIIAAYLIYLFSGYSFWIILGAMFVLGIISHRIFCVRTTVDKFLFPYE